MEGRREGRGRFDPSVRTQPPESAREKETVLRTAGRRGVGGCGAASDSFACQSALAAATRGQSATATDTLMSSAVVSIASLMVGVGAGWKEGLD